MQNSGLVGRITSRIAAWVAEHWGSGGEDIQPSGRPAADGTWTGVFDAGALAAFQRTWKRSKTREERHEVRTRMDNEDELVSKALDVIADVATAPAEEGDARASFTVECEDDKTREEIELFVKGLRLREASWGVARRLAKFGNEMREQVADESATRIIRSRMLPEQQLHYREDEHGVPKDPPWEQRPSYKADGTGIPFAMWQICHYAYPGDEDERYGRGTLDVELTWQRLQAIEDDLVLGRRVRSMLRLVHKVPVSKGSSQDEIEQALVNAARRHKQEEILDASQGTGARRVLPSATGDYYVPVAEDLPETGIDAIDPANRGLANIRDVEYFRARFLARLGVPMRYLNLGGAEAVRASIGSGGLSYEDMQFARSERRLQSVLAEGHSRTIALHLILRGLDPIANPFELHFPIISTQDARLDAEIEYKRAQTLKLIADIIEVPAELVVNHYMGLSPDEAERYFGDLQEAVAGAIAARSHGSDPGSLRNAAAGILVLADSIRQRRGQELLAEGEEEEAATVH